MGTTQSFDSEVIEQLRKKKKRKRLRITLMVVIAVLALFIWLTGVASASLTTIGEAFETARLKIFAGPGFPVTLAMETNAQCTELNASFVLVDSRDVNVYSESGSALRSFQHGYAKPYLTGAGTRFCIYNQGGKELRIEGRSRTLGTINTEKAIQFVTMNKQGGFAVVTQSSSYQAQMSVYDRTMSEVFTWYCANGYPITASFSPSGSEVAIACITSTNGVLDTTLYLVNESGERLSVNREDSVPLHISYRTSKEILVTYDTEMVLYNTTDFSVAATYKYSDSILCADTDSADGILLVIGDDSRADSVTLVLLSKTLEPVRTVSVGEPVTQGKLKGDTAYLICKSGTRSYSMDASEAADALMATEHRPILLIDSKKMLLLTAKQIIEMIV